MKLKLSLIYLIISVITIQAQNDSIYDNFEAHTPIRELKCGLWINAEGDIAYKEESCTYFIPPTIIEDSTIIYTSANDSLHFSFDFFDGYITSTYNLQDSLNNAMNDYRSELKNVVDTASFQILGKSYCKDKNNIYIIQAMAAGGVIFAMPYDKKFKICDTDSSYATDSQNCYHLGWVLPDADPKTFKVIPNVDFPLSRDKNNFYHGWSKLNTLELKELERDLNIELYSKDELQIYADSLKYIKEIPYIHNCTDPIFWNIVAKGKSIVPLLIDKLTDTKTLKDVDVRFFGGKYTIADVALVVINEIVADVPYYELIGIEFSTECGSCAYWYHVQENKENRKKFQKAIRKWYDSNKNNLIWTESLFSLTGDCFSPIRGHYKIDPSIE